MTTRRSFLGAGAALFAGTTLASALQPTRSKPVASARKPLSLLFLGGTGFIGPHQIEYALERGHTVTMFNRGRKSGFYGERVEELTGDRDPDVGEGLAALAGDRRWDAVIDNSGYVPRHVRASAELLKDRVGRYLYTSTVAVYDFKASPSVDREGPLLPALALEIETVDGETYGPLKAEGDRIVRQIYGARATVVRPTFIVGPGDTTDRFTYWVDRLHRGGDVVCPPLPQNEAQWIDVRDLCPWLIRLVEDATPGAFNAVGPASKMTLQELIWGLRAFASAPTRLHWPSLELVDELGFPTPMFDWSRGDRHVDASAAVTNGLTYHSLAETARDTQAWWLSQTAERRASPRGWPTKEQEMNLLKRLG